MAYIGLEPSNSFVSLKRQVITGDGTTSYTLDHSVASVNDVAIFVNNVRQDPASYSISGTALTLGGTISSSDSCYVIFLGQALQTVTPDADTITTAMLKSNAVTTAKITDANVTSAKMFSGFANGITVADQWRVTSGFTGDANPISSNWERNDTTGAGFIGSAMPQSSGIFTCPSTGIYRVDFHVTMSLNSNSRYNLIAIMKTLDNSSYAEAATTYAHISNNTSSTTYASAHADTIIDVTNTSNVKVSFQVEHHDNNTTVTGGSAVDYTWAHFLRLGDT